MTELKPRSSRGVRLLVGGLRLLFNSVLLLVVIDPVTGVSAHFGR